LVRKRYLFPPLSEINIFSPLVTCRFFTLVVQFFPILHLFDAFTSHFLLFFALSSVLFYLFSFFLPLLIFFPRNGIGCFLRAFLFLLAYLCTDLHILVETNNKGTSNRVSCTLISGNEKRSCTTDIE
jgi:hypothetical protein